MFYCAVVSLYKENITTIIDINKKHKVYGFKEEYIQVILTIITNAIYVLTDKREKVIIIKSSYIGNTSTLAISDSGGGIPEEIIDKIFELHYTTKKQNQGSGLGLYIAKMIIEKRMCGEINVSNIYNTSNSSSSIKYGAKFSISI